MWVVGVVGHCAHDLSSRLSRHIERLKAVSPDDPSMPLQTQIVSCIAKVNEITSEMDKRNPMLLLVIDPPNRDNPNFRPIIAATSNTAESRWIPFYLSVPANEIDPSYEYVMTTKTTLAEAAKMFTEVTGEPFTCDAAAADYPVMTESIIRHLERWNATSDMPLRADKTTAEKDNQNLGRGTVIVVTAGKGGTGKSTMSMIIARNMAEFAVERGEKALLIDANISQPTIFSMAWEKPPKDITWVLSGLEEGHDPQSLISQAVYPLGGKTNAAINRVMAIGGAVNPGITREWKPGAVYRLVREAAKEYDYVIVDTLPIDDSVRRISDGFIVPSADVIIAIVDPDKTAVENTLESLRKITTPTVGARFPREKVFIAMNKEGVHGEFNLESARRVATSMSEEGAPEWNIVTGIPFTPQITAQVNQAHGMIPKEPEVDKAVAKLIGKALNISPSDILGVSTSKKSKNGGGGFSRFMKNLRSK